MRWVISLLALLIVVVAGTVANADSDEQQLRAIYAKVSSDFNVQNTVKGIWYNQTEDYTHRFVDGTVRNKKDDYARLQLTMGLFTHVDHWSFRVDKVSVEGNKAVVEVTQDLKGDLKVKNGGVASFKGTSVVKDTWSRTPAGWKVKFADELQTNIEMARQGD
jgi:hypothetical protein